jgi:hypothetical protein
MNRRHKEFIRRLNAAGITVTKAQQRSNSVALDCKHGRTTVRYFMSISPSDHRAMDNAFHDIKRALGGTT